MLSAFVELIAYLASRILTLDVAIGVSAGVVGSAVTAILSAYFIGRFFEHKLSDVDSQLSELSIKNLHSVLWILRFFTPFSDRILDIPKSRLPLLLQVTRQQPPFEERLYALAKLLGMVEPDSAEVIRPTPTLTVLAAQLPFPEVFRDRTIGLVEVNGQELLSTDPDQLYTVLEVALRTIKHPPEYPAIVLASNDYTAKRVAAPLHGHLTLTEAELRTLMFADGPGQRWLDCCMSEVSWRFLHT